MKDETHLHDLLRAALDLPLAERETFIRGHTPGDPDTTETLMTLLREAESGDGTDSFVAGRLGPDLVADLAAATSRDAYIGTRVGPFVIERKLGQGGMGSVFLAHRDDPVIDQHVAIKFPHPGLLDSGDWVRFHSEEKILARLTHPGIARFYDAALTEGGAPYFVMEYVDGVRITEYCDRNALGLRERLELLREVCDTVAYAQQNLVVHRDLKPSNILVASNGHVKLLDFGIARLLDSETGEATMTCDAALTPLYAAPEQLSGGHVTTATDVYSLGIVLYELLTGRSPYSDSASHADIVRQVCEAVPIAPGSLVRRLARSTKESTRPVGHQRLPWADIDSIVLKALRKDAASRYGSASAMSEDIGRLLGGMPVAARRGSTAYRVGRFVMRHRAGVSTAIAILVLVAALVAMYSVRIDREKDRAELEAERAGLVSEMITEMFNPTTVTAEQLTAHLTGMRERFRDRKQLIAPILKTAGDVFLTLGQPSESLELYLEADSLIRSDHSATAADSIFTRLDVVRATTGLMRNEIRANMDQDELAFRSFEPVERLRAHADSLVSVSYSQANAVGERGLAAEALLLRALLYWPIDNELVKTGWSGWEAIDSTLSQAQREYSSDMTARQQCGLWPLRAKLLEYAMEHTTEFPLVDEAYGTALNQCVAAHGYTSRSVMNVLKNWGQDLWRHYHHERGNALLSASIDLARQFYPTGSQEFVQLLFNLALSELSGLNFEDSERHLNEALALVESLTYSPDEASTEHFKRYLWFHAAAAKRALRRYADADSLLRLVPEYETGVIAGWIALELEDLDKAAASLSASVEVRQDTSYAPGPVFVDAVAPYAHVLSLLGRCHEAVPLLESTLYIWRKTNQSVLAGSALGRCRVVSGDIEGAVEAYYLAAKYAHRFYMPEVETEIREFFGRLGSPVPDTLDALLKDQNPNNRRYRDLMQF